MTLVINLVGSFAIGLIAGLAGTRSSLSPHTVLFLQTGLCGGFTTFSTFSLETVRLINTGRIAVAGSYAVLSVLLCLCGTWLGLTIARQFQP
jgi:CrcB protein